jgi:hypothetical protein
MLDIVEAECKVRHILVHHCRKGFYCEGDSGLPDLILVGSHDLAFWELKSNDFLKLSSSQRQWDWKLRGTGHWVRLVTPSDMPRVGDYLDALNEEDCP